MNKTENKKNGLIQSQRSLYTKFKSINCLFKIHLSSLTLLFLLALGYIILWLYLVFTGQTIPELSQIYGLFGTIVTILITSVLSLLIIQIGIQIIFYGLFIIRGNRSLKQTKDDKIPRTASYNVIVPFITNFYAFFNRYSKQKTTLVKRVKTFLFLNFFSGFLVIFLSTRILDTGSANVLINVSMVIIFLLLLFFWLMSLMTSFKIQKEIDKWEKLFPKLDEWAQDLEQFSLINLNDTDEEAPP
jgi:hypothetical protein